MHWLQVMNALTYVDDQCIELMDVTIADVWWGWSIIQNYLLLYYRKYIPVRWTESLAEKYMHAYVHVVELL